MLEKPNILQLGRIHPDLDARLAAHYDVEVLERPADLTALPLERREAFAGLVTSAFVGADAMLIGALPNLKVISSFGVGYDKIDMDAARARNIPVGYTPDVLTDCVADLALGLMLDAARQISAADRFVRAGAWAQQRYPLSRKVSGKRLGIVGLGRIGRAIAQRAQGFNMPIHYHNRHPVADAPYAYVEDLLELAHWSDFLMVSAAGGAQTQKLISAEVLEALGPDGILINIARGSVVDEAALVQALQTRRIAGAGLDVFADEPHPSPELLRMDTVVLTPHISSATVETRQAMADRTFDNLTAFFTAGEMISAA